MWNKKLHFFVILIAANRLIGKSSLPLISKEFLQTSFPRVNAIHKIKPIIIFPQGYISTHTYNQPIIHIINTIITLNMHYLQDYVGHFHMTKLKHQNNLVTLFLQTTLSFRTTLTFSQLAMLV